MIEAEELACKELQSKLIKVSGNDNIEIRYKEAHKSYRLRYETSGRSVWNLVECYLPSLEKSFHKHFNASNADKFNDQWR